MKFLDRFNPNHPFYKRLKLRSRLAWFLINLGLGDKGENCEKVNAEHYWYKIDSENFGCYYCNRTKK